MNRKCLTLFQPSNAKASDFLQQHISLTTARLYRVALTSYIIRMFNL